MREKERQHCVCTPKLENHGALPEDSEGEAHTAGTTAQCSLMGKYPRIDFPQLQRCKLKRKTLTCISCSNLARFLYDMSCVKLYPVVPSGAQAACLRGPPAPYQVLEANCKNNLERAKVNRQRRHRPFGDILSTLQREALIYFYLHGGMCEGL